MAISSLHARKLKQLFFNYSILIYSCIFILIFYFNEKESITVCVPYNYIDTTCDRMRTTSGVLVFNFNSIGRITKFIDKFCQKICSAEFLWLCICSFLALNDLIVFKLLLF